MDCPVCKKEFNSSMGLARHILQARVMEPEHKEFWKNFLGSEKPFKPLALKIDNYLSLK